MRTNILAEEDHTLQFRAHKLPLALLLLWVLLLLLSGIASRQAPIEADQADHAAWTASTGSSPLAFVRRDGGGLIKSIRRIYVMNLDGAPPIPVTQEIQGWDVAPSPDGNRLAFTCPMDGNLEICIVDVDGSHLIRLTHNPAMDQSPTWSPDGARIVFASDRTGRFQIYMMDTDGLGQTPLTHTAADELQPAWSPDGRHIAFTSDRVIQDGVLLTRDIFVMNADGSNQTNLTRSSTASVSESPAWSPDSSRIAFASNRGELSFQIYTVNADGSDSMRLTTSQAQDRHPAWSPDGQQIAFDSTRAVMDSSLRLMRDEPQIHVMHADGSAQTRITSDIRQFSSRPAWLSGTGAMTRAQAGP